jgi:hypothetical protein
LHDYQELKRGGAGPGRGDPTHGWMNVKEININEWINVEQIIRSGWMNA